MPIDPVRLRARAAEAAAQLVNPPACAAAIHRLLDDYTDYSRRASPRLTDSAPVNILGVPAPVVRAVLAALRRPAQAAPGYALALARALWASGTREERRLAAEIVGLAAPGLPAEALALIESWLPEIESGETADALAQHGLGPLLARDAYDFLIRAQRWTLQHNRWVRRFGVAVIAALARDRRWDDVPAALDILRGLMSESDPGVRQAVIVALQGLLPRNPTAVVSFMREQAGRPDHNIHMVLRATLRALPEEVQAELVRVMRA